MTELKTPRDVMQAFLDGKRLTCGEYGEDSYAYLDKEGHLRDSDGDLVNENDPDGINITICAGDNSHWWEIHPLDREHPGDCEGGAADRIQKAADELLTPLTKRVSEILDKKLVEMCCDCEKEEQKPARPDLVLSDVIDKMAAVYAKEQMLKLCETGEARSIPIEDFLQPTVEMLERIAELERHKDAVNINIRLLGEGINKHVERLDKHSETINELIPLQLKVCNLEYKNGNRIGDIQAIETRLGKLEAPKLVFDVNRNMLIKLESELVKFGGEVNERLDKLEAAQNQTQSMSDITRFAMSIDAEASVMMKGIEPGYNMKRLETIRNFCARIIGEAE